MQEQEAKSPEHMEGPAMLLGRGQDPERREGEDEEQEEGGKDTDNNVPTCCHFPFTCFY